MSDNKCFEDDVCNRLCEAAILANNYIGIRLELNGLGVVVKRTWKGRCWEHTVGYLDIATANCNILVQIVHEALEQL